MQLLKMLLKSDQVPCPKVQNRLHTANLSFRLYVNKLRNNLLARQDMFYHQQTPCAQRSQPSPRPPSTLRSKARSRSCAVGNRSLRHLYLSQYGHTLTLHTRVGTRGLRTIILGGTPNHYRCRPPHHPSRAVRRFRSLESYN